MKHIAYLSLIAALVLFGCNSATKPTKLAKRDSVIKSETSIKSDETKLADKAKDKQQIQILIRQMLTWADSKNELDLRSRF